MLKGYWVVRADVNDLEGFRAYLASNGIALEKHGARFLARAGRQEVLEGSSRSRNTVVEFPSYQAALDCWNSPEYQAARQHRLGAADFDLVVLEGCE
jgi:uncharacterized protein (DUF1330 family)